MTYKILVFDLDDTLIDNRANVRGAFRKMLAAENMAYSDAEFERWYEIDKKFWVEWQDGLIEIPDELKHETSKKSDTFLDWVRSQRVLSYFDHTITQARAIELNTIYMYALHEVVVAIDGVKDTLEYLSGKHTVIVATNGPSVATKQKLKKIGCLEYVTDVLSADMFGYMKPKIEFFEAIEKRYKDFERNDYLIIGDSLKSDVGFGNNAGIDSCWFNRMGEPTGDLTPTYTIQHLYELKKFL